MLFNLKKQTTKKDNHAEGKIFAVQSGLVIPITEVNDDVFAQKMLGDGVAIRPESGIIVSPVNGRIINIADTFHAYGLQTEDGLEILVHIGIDTVDLNGKGFRNHVRIDEKVTVGTPLCTVDLSLLKQNGYDTDIIVLVTGPTECDDPLIIHTGVTAKAQQTCIMEYHRKK
ncbi:PTS sugar transporter subunit IIA [Caproiciproducens sp. R1]|jgi:PTS system, glucose subfamily, IIA component|uniref:PTS glucose transporter subunit IIA n=1 Tax=Caproiciproducens sp. R1 TaxID=3435000 RepID=UPI0005713671|nr:PTS glucose transporter subunit IIA [Oscillospiraceae bacterium]